MIITRLHLIRFGRFCHRQFEFRDGLNFIHGPNESGKSTLAAFIRAMFYGLPARRIHTPLEEERTHYAPWAGGDLEGEMWVSNHDGRSFHIQRSLTAGGGMRRDRCQVLDGVTGMPVLEAQGMEPGQFLLGIDSETYEKTLFISQAGSCLTGGGEEISRRLANLRSSGEDDISYEETRKYLDGIRRSLTNQMHRGELDLCRTEIHSIRERMGESDRDEDSMDRLRERMTVLKQEKLLQEARIRELLDKKRSMEDLRDRYRQQEGAHETCCAALEEFRNREAAAFQGFKDLPRDISSRVTARMEEKGALTARLAQTTPADARPVRAVIPILAAVSVLAMLTAALRISGAGTGTLLPWLAWPTAVLLFTALMIAAVRMLRARKTENMQRKQLYSSLDRVNDILNTWFGQCGAADAAEFFSRFEAYRELEGRMQRMKEEADRLGRECSQTLDKIRETAAILKDNRDLTQEGMKAAFEEELRIAAEQMDRLDRETGDVQSNLARFQAKEAGYVLLTEQLAAALEKEGYLKRKAEASALAIRVLDDCYGRLQRDFAPRLSARAGEIFSMITACRYAEVKVDPASLQMKVRAGEQTDEGLKDSGYLSIGTRDQLYFSLRMAIALEMQGHNGREQAVQGNETRLPPLVLDDSFLQYDPERAGAALEFLAALPGQVLLFSCRDAALPGGKGCWRLELPGSKLDGKDAR
ncbi:MAG TPA: hypothetical protein DD727_07655 [Clostridiales bacterium]|nr:hypothetical protein [Clostridiales bacterium]